MKKPGTKSITNKRARFDYELSDTFLVGLELSGAEAKSLRMKHGDIKGAYVNVINDELWLINASIHGTKGVPINEEQVTRSRKLLAKRSEIDQLVASKRSGRTIVPLELLTTGRYVKLRIAVGKGKKKYDKRESIKQRDQEREANRNI